MEKNRDLQHKTHAEKARADYNRVCDAYDLIMDIADDYGGINPDFGLKLNSTILEILKTLLKHEFSRTNN
jgi:hypothetical protein